MMRASHDNPALDDPVGESLRGHHRHLSRGHGRAITYAPGVATFVAVPTSHRLQDWDDLALLLGHDGFADMFSSPAIPPPQWKPVFTMEGVQMTGPPSLATERDAAAEVLTLGSADVSDMLELVARTRPGPFWTRTIAMGTYVGIRDRGRLVAMAGERLHPPGWSEISTVCTAPEARGRGLASRLVRQAASQIIARGERPFLHVATDNTAAFALYQRLGFQVRRPVTFRGFRVPY
jgi:ribosomal protein S18 acetylase RimI-like enzyme